MGFIVTIDFLSRFQEDNDLTQLGLSNPNKTQSKSRLRDSGTTDNSSLLFNFFIPSVDSTFFLAHFKDYNPLMGAGGGSGACFRPARRGGGGARGG